MCPQVTLCWHIFCEHSLNSTGPVKIVKEDPDFEKLRPNFMWPPVDTADLFDHQKRKQAEHRSKSGLNDTEQSNLAKAEKS
jgi:hypothetical protein